MDHRDIFIVKWGQDEYGDEGDLISRLLLMFLAYEAAQMMVTFTGIWNTRLEPVLEGN